MKIIRMEGMEEKIAALAGVPSLFDVIRKKRVAATPEEKARQVFIRYLMDEKNFPRALLAVEVSLKINRMQKRCDILAYKYNAPALMVECKAPSVKLDQSVFEQASRYNLALRVPYLVITNGLVSLCCRIERDAGTFVFLNDLPDYSQL